MIFAGCREAFDASAFRHSANSHFCLDLQAFLWAALGTDQKDLERNFAEYYTHSIVVW